MRGLVIAAPASGSGKTTVALALIAAARRRGLTVQSFKVGPDFIDPGHHARVSGRAARTLDGWMLGRAACEESFAHAGATADLALVEGMMGLFDGVSGGSETGSTAEIAKWLDLPVVLVVDAGAMARSAAALVHGFCGFDPDLRVAGVIFNRLGGAAHLRSLRAALASRDAPPCFGGLPLDAALAIPERHLGLMTAAEVAPPVQRLADVAERHLDVDGLLALAGAGGAPAGGRSYLPGGAGSEEARLRAQKRFAPRRASSLPAPPGGARARDVVIAVARDEAFSFYYPENLELLVQAGAELVEFSPLHDGRLPPHASGVYLGGGYPEVHAARLAANVGLLGDLRRFAATGGLVYAECGGLMLLGAALVDHAGAEHRMAGVLPFRTRMLPRALTLGYREVEIGATAFLPALSARGHEFHCSTLDEASVPPGLARLYAVRDPVSGVSGREGYGVGRVLASYIHLHFASAPSLARALVAAAHAAAAEPGVSGGAAR